MMHPIMWLSHSLMYQITILSDGTYRLEMISTSLAPIKFKKPQCSGFVILSANQQSTKSIDPQNRSCLHA